MRLQIFGKLSIAQQLDEGYRIGIRRHNEEVTKNRRILSRIIDCVKFCGAFELALRGHDESEGSDNLGIFRGLVDFVASLDGVLKEHLENATVFKGTSKTVQNELLDCMLSVVREQIIQDAQSSDFLSIQADETTDIATQCQLVLVLRYIDAKGNVCDTILRHTLERFSFTDHLVSATLLQADRFEQYTMAFPEDALSRTLKAYPVLDGSKLKTELSLIYCKEEFRACCGALDLLQLFMENNLEEVFSETVTLLKILVTTPMTTAEAERCFSTLKRIKTFLRNSMTQERLNALAMLSIEKRLVTEMTDFNQKVIEKFASQKERRAKFVFR
ncbi:zinc finger MYM-type 1-like protein [Labeo rohita]|uniref:Zinc finger MYM-type 1-like protein n=1 Tax=Labeo rohita TaxID=84645 RepID=A0A498LR43_LABRO|nr:zinc finger MYM-type 1-like protein [Labeo rohita]